MKRTVGIRIRADNPRFAQFYHKICAGEGKIFHGFRTYITMRAIVSEPISTIWLDLVEKLA